MDDEDGYTYYTHITVLKLPIVFISLAFLPPPLAPGVHIRDAKCTLKVASSLQLVHDQGPVRAKNMSRFEWT